MAGSQHHPSMIVLLVIAPLLAWRLYARTRRMVGRQRFSRVRSWMQLLLFSLLALVLGLATLTHPERLALLAAGLCAGAWLGRFGLRKTQFELAPHGFLYTPNAHLGIALSLLVAVRVVYRLVEVFVLEAAGPGGLRRSPLTLAAFGLLAGYYVSYAVGLLAWRRRVARTAA